MNSSVATVIAVMLAGTFAWAALAKLRNQRSTTKGFATLGLPQAKRLAVVVPLTELLIGAALLALPAAGALASVVLLVAFTMVLVRAQRASVNEIRCGCFGAADTEPVTWVTYIRNAGLGFAAVGVFAIQPPSLLNVSVGPLLAVTTSAATMALIGSVGLALLTMRRQVGVFFSQGPGKSSSEIPDQQPRGINGS